MADDYYLIKGSTLTDMADAIRSKDGTTETISVSDMATRIQAIETAGKTVERKDSDTDSKLSFMSIAVTDAKCTITIETDADINNLYSVSLFLRKETSGKTCNLYWNLVTAGATYTPSSKIELIGCGYIYDDDMFDKTNNPEGIATVDCLAKGKATFLHNVITISVSNSSVFYDYRQSQGSMDWPSDGTYSWEVVSVVVYD